MGDKPTLVDHEATALGEKLWEGGVGPKQRRQPLPSQNSLTLRRLIVKVHKDIETRGCQQEKHPKIVGKKINYTMQILIKKMLA